MTFRAKLLRTILALVVITTAASLLIAQRQNAAVFQSVVDALFAEQMKAFQQAQELPIQAAKAEAGRLAQSVRLFAALEEGDPEVVYQIAGDELRLGEFAFFRLLDAEGKLIPPGPEVNAGVFEVEGLRGEWLPRGPVLPEAGDVDLGFVESKGIVYRLLVCQIRNFDQTVGSLILGQPMARDTAILLDGQFIGEGVPQALRGRLMTTKGPEGQLELEKVTYRFARYRLNAGHTRYPPADWISVFSLAELARQQRVLAWRIGLTGLAALLLAALVTVALSRQLAQPVADLVQAAQEVREGRYEVRLPPTQTFELNNLGSAFNEMAAGLALRDRYHSVLQQVTDPHVAEELVQGRVSLGGEMREVSVIFCDIRGYTEMSAARDPVEVIELLNHHLGALTRVVQKHRGVINKFAGDAIMVLFGAPKAYGDDASRALCCAWEMMQERERLNRLSSEPLGIGIGLATGQVVAGCVGTESRSEYTVIGERVNLAARLCSAAQAGEVIIDADTREKTAAKAVFEPLEPLSLKGYSRPVQAFKVLSMPA